MHFLLLLLCPLPPFSGVQVLSSIFSSMQVVDSGQSGGISSSVTESTTTTLSFIFDFLLGYLYLFRNIPGVFSLKPSSTQTTVTPCELPQLLRSSSLSALISQPHFSRFNYTLQVIFQKSKCVTTSVPGHARSCRLVLAVLGLHYIKG